ncbi:MAG TPA: EAL domain-containing protein [Pseudolabrys sp.]|nr:EAL domain-containing protein [Pseudolabrys sp.]
MPNRARQSRFHLLLAVAGGLTCASALAIGVTILWLRSDAMAIASRDSSNLATVLAHQLENSVQSIDLVLTEVKDKEGLRAQQGPIGLDRDLREDTYRTLMERQTRLRQAEFIAVVDRDGNLVSTTRQWPTPKISVSDRPYFQYLKRTNDKRVYISATLYDRIKGLPVIIFAKRINGANDTFLGAVVVGVRLAYFQHIYESIASLPDQSFLLLNRDGTIIVRFPDPKDRAYEKMPATSPWYQLIMQGGGQYRSPGYFDSTARLVAVHPLRHYSLVVNVALSETAALATWRIQAITLGTGALLVTLCVAFLLRAQSQQFRRLAASEATVEAALDNMSQGLAMFDASDRLVVCNRRYLEMYGLSSDVVKPGATLLELAEHRAATGSFCTEDIEQYIADIQTAVAQGAVFGKMTTLRDGRIISIVNHPTADGGWVATHEDITEQKRAEERISYAAHHDALTGLPNRKLFSEQLEQALKRVRRGERLAVLYLDLDHLKRVNDTLGHSVGDKLLKGVADRLRGCVREIDMVARLSGDEFAIIQTSISRPSDAADLATRTREAIHEPFVLDGHQVIVDISVGISIAPNDATELNDLLKTADIALYEAKNTGRGTYCFYQTEMNERMQTRSRLERDLQSALANGEFELFYQPIVDLEDNKIKTCEALLRWRHPERGLVSPAEFIPVAEETGLIVPLGEWVLRTACAEAATWPVDIGIAVNVSAIQLTSKNLINTVIGAIATSGLPANRLILEITESVFLANTFANLATLKNLHKLGVRFAMDDFGTGYSSLGYLVSFPFSKIKIDRSFIAGLADRTESRAVVRAIADLACSLNMRIVAEGVETAEQRQHAQMLGCTDIQGYLISVPRPAREIYELLLADAQSAAGIIGQVA